MAAASTPRADAFIAASQGGLACDRARLESRLGAIQARSAALVPGVRVDEAEFAASTARSDAVRGQVSGESEPSIDDEALTELVLAAGVRRGDRTALSEVERRYVAPLDAALARMRLGSAGLDEVKQRVREKLLMASADGATALDGYAGAGRLAGLFRVAATRAALDMVRRERPDARSAPDLLDGLPGAEADPELAALRDRCRTEFRAAFEEAALALEQRERNLLRLHLLGGVTLEQLASMYTVHRATVVRWLADARRALLAGTRKGLQARLRVRPDELESLMRLCESGLDVSVERLLRSRAGADGDGSDDEGDARG